MCIRINEKKDISTTVHKWRCPNHVWHWFLARVCSLLQNTALWTMKHIQPWRFWHWSAQHLWIKRITYYYIHYLCNCFYAERVCTVTVECCKCRIINSFNICINDIVLLSHFNDEKKAQNQKHFFKIWYINTDTSHEIFHVINIEYIKSS